MRLSIRGVLLSYVILLAGLCLAPRPAAAQSLGVRVGASADPDQFVIGAHYETRPIVESITFRPNIEVGVGNDLTVTCLNFEFAYKFASTKPWRVYAGGGPALVLINTERDDHAEGGFNILLGIEHRQGLFAEIKAGALDSPDFKILVGYTFH